MRAPQNRTWPELAAGLFDQLTSRKAEITYDLDNLALSIPAAVGEPEPSARWILNGTLRVHTRAGARD